MTQDKSSSSTAKMSQLLQSPISIREQILQKAAKNLEKKTGMPWVISGNTLSCYYQLPVNSVYSNTEDFRELLNHEYYKESKRPFPNKQAISMVSGEANVYVKEKYYAFEKIIELCSDDVEERKKFQQLLINENKQALAMLNEKTGLLWNCQPNKNVDPLELLDPLFLCELTEEQYQSIPQTIKEELNLKLEPGPSGELSRLSYQKKRAPLSPAEMPAAVLPKKLQMKIEQAEIRKQHKEEALDYANSLEKSLVAEFRAEHKTRRPTTFGFLHPTRIKETGDLSLGQIIEFAQADKNSLTMTLCRERGWIDEQGKINEGIAEILAIKEDVEAWLKQKEARKESPIPSSGDLQKKDEGDRELTDFASGGP